MQNWRSQDDMFNLHRKWRLCFSPKVFISLNTETVAGECFKSQKKSLRSVSWFLSDVFQHIIFRTLWTSSQISFGCMPSLPTGFQISTPNQNTRWPEQTRKKVEHFRCKIHEFKQDSSEKKGFFPSPKIFPQEPNTEKENAASTYWKLPPK